VLRELTESLLHHRRELLQSYRPHDLHQLRVHIRRIRSLARHVPSLAQPELQRAWRELFVQTNIARDWDVLMDVASQRLEGQDAAHWAAALKPELQSHRGQALAMLASPAWTRQQAAWQVFVDALPEAPLLIPDALLAAALQRARETWEQAKETGEPSAWHRYRLAVKNVRYLAASWQTAEPGKPGLDELIQRCKGLQDLLGTWHDCTVQLKILRSDPVRDRLATHPQARAAAEQLARHVSQRRAQLMNEINAAPAL
jgi:CHAD domain-containing protein